MPRKPIAMTARPVVPRGTDLAPLIEALTAQTMAITALVEAIHSVAAKAANPMVHAPVSVGQAEVAAEMRRVVPRRILAADPPADPIEMPQQQSDRALADLAQQAGLYDESPMPAPDTESMWRKRLSLHAMKLWQPEWGPQPGHEGCEVPAHLMNGRGAR